MSEWLLVVSVWTACGLIWWVASFFLVAARRTELPAGQPADLRRISVFKPVAGPLGPQELKRLRGCIESFVAELDERSELLVGVTEPDRAQMAAVLQEMSARYPSAELRLVVHGEHDDYANRKISLMRAMARHATGELWFWSDADMQAPAGTLRSLRRDLAADDRAAFVTSPYTVLGTGGGPEVLDKLFVNLEFYPGVMLLGRLDLIRFSFGSGVLFEAERFERCVDWDFLGDCLADDYHLGRLLGAGRLGSTSLTTVPGADGWSAALLHYLRWHKTIRWCRPGSYAAQLAVLSVVGWLLAVMLNPLALVPWLGLTTVVALDAAAAYSVCRALECRLAWRHLPVAAAWSLIRGAVWLACWLPWPIVWHGRKWWTPRPQAQSRPAVLGGDGPPGAA